MGQAVKLEGHQEPSLHHAILARLVFLCNSFHYLSREKLPDLHVYKYTFRHNIEHKKKQDQT
jgi:hypothetical protein